MNTELTPQFLSQKVWDLYQTSGVPIEVSLNIMEENKLQIDEELLANCIKKHQEMSQSQTGQFKSGLGNDSNKTRSLHTTTHILHTILRNLFGVQVTQKGSNITDQKARFDFSLDKKLEKSDLDKITLEVQKIIDQKLEMTKTEMTENEARELGAIGLFGEKYGNIVSVYTLAGGDFVFSREFCGGPHIANTQELGKFTIIKQKSIGQNLRRIEFDLV
jgi:alanyl-tRNA synthetase